VKLSYVEQEIKYQAMYASLAFIMLLGKGWTLRTCLFVELNVVVFALSTVEEFCICLLPVVLCLSFPFNLVELLMTVD